MVENNVVMFGGSADENNKESFTMIYDIDDDWKNCKLTYHQLLLVLALI